MTGKFICIKGLSGAGKTTLAGGLVNRINELGVYPILLNVDRLRNIFHKDKLYLPSYNRDERISLARKYHHLSLTLSEQGSKVVVSIISIINNIYTQNKKNLKNYFGI